MPDSDFQGSIERLPERVRERLKLGARERFILLFALFNAMFCFLFVLLLQNRQYVDHIEMIEATATEEAVKVTIQRSEIEALEDTVSTLEDKISELLFPTPTPTVVPPTVASTPVPPASTPRPTVPPTLVPSPTATPVPPTPTNTPVPPTPTLEPTPTPESEPEPKPKPPPRPTDPPPPRPPG
jgi:cell division protein FtsB